MFLRLIKLGFVLGLLGVLGFATLIWGETKGWWAKSLSATERSTMLAPYDEVFVPDAAQFGPPPYPGVVLLHNCYGGIDQMRDWARLLAANGMIAHVSDSYAGRGLGDNRFRAMGCRSALLYPVERAGDVMTGLDRFRQHPALDASRLVVLGFSHGGTTLFEALAVVAAGSAPRGFEAPFSKQVWQDVRAFGVLYPNCGVVNQTRTFSASVPFLWLQGTQDVVTPVEECTDIMAAARAAGTKIEFHALEDANHNFDMLTGTLANPDPIKGKADRAKAQKLVLEFLRRNL